MASVPLSAILLAYNRPDFLPRMLDSVLMQQMRAFELILIDNGSTDGRTPEICRRFAEKDGRIRLLTMPENHGPAPARNLGIDTAGGEFIIQLDDDDSCEPDHFSRLYDLIRQYDADVAISGCGDEVNGERRIKYQYDGIHVWNREEAVSEFLKREKFHTAPATKLYRASVYQGIRYVPGKIIDDTHVTYRLMANVRSAVAHGKPTYWFRKFGGNTTAFLDQNILWPELLEEYLLMQKDRVAYISELVPKEAAHVRYAAWSYMISMVEKIHQGQGPRCEAQLEAMVRTLRQNADEILQAPWLTPREQRLMDAYVLER
jgi:glycosyltransferase involved in cell wall biosynthesis